MKVLLLTTKFLHEDGSLWLTSELANTLAESGNSVTVINLQWSKNFSAPQKNLHENVKLFSIKSINFKFKNSLSIPLKWILSSIKVFVFIIYRLAFREKFDLLISFSPCTALYAAIPISKLICKDSCLIYWDFFPIHNQEISGKAPKFSVPTLKYLEERLVSVFDRVGVMSDANLLFFKKYFKDFRNQLSIIPIWTSYLGDENSTKKSSLASSKLLNEEIVFVFGGQLIEGRGVLELCEAFIAANIENPAIKLIICGSGHLSSQILKYHEKRPNAITLLNHMPREKYLNLLKSSDVGVVATVPGVSIPSFPSKSLDYMASELPILAITEKTSDFGKIIEDNHIGIHCNAGNIAESTDAILFLAKLNNKRTEMGKNGNIYLKKNHSINIIASKILGN